MIHDAKIALIAVTQEGVLSSEKLANKLGSVTLFCPQKFSHLVSSKKFINIDVFLYTNALKMHIGGIFKAFDQLVFFLALGAVVRLVAPHLGCKYQDPGVLVIDQENRFVIPVLSGHVGYANAYAQKIATLIGAQAIITTASDSSQTFSVDILGREQGWQVEAPKINLTRVAAMLVNAQPIALIEEAEPLYDWPYAWPANVTRFSQFTAVNLQQYQGILWVTHTAIPPDIWQQLHERLVVYRPAFGN